MNGASVKTPPPLLRRTVSSRRFDNDEEGGLSSLSDLDSSPLKVVMKKRKKVAEAQEVDGDNEQTPRPRGAKQSRADGKKKARN